MDEMLWLDALQTIHVPWLDGVMVTVSLLTNAGIGWIVLGVVLICIRRYRRCGIALVMAVILAGVVSKLIIGEVVMRPRPCDVNPQMPLLIPRPFGTSFPSGHTTAAFATLAVLAVFRMPKGFVISVAVLAVLVAFSRMYLFVHYPSDVLVGAVLGAIIGFACAWVLRPKEPEASGT